MTKSQGPRLQLYAINLQASSISCIPSTGQSWVRFSRHGPRFGDATPHICVGRSSLWGGPFLGGLLDVCVARRCPPLVDGGGSRTDTLLQRHDGACAESDPNGVGLSRSGARQLSGHPIDPAALARLLLSPWSRDTFGDRHERKLVGVQKVKPRKDYRSHNPSPFPSRVSHTVSIPRW